MQECSSSFKFHCHSIDDVLVWIFFISLNYYWYFDCSSFISGNFSGYFLLFTFCLCCYWNNYKYISISNSILVCFRWCFLYILYSHFCCTFFSKYREYLLYIVQVSTKNFTICFGGPFLRVWINLVKKWLVWTYIRRKHLLLVGFKEINQATSSSLSSCNLIKTIQGKLFDHVKLFRLLIRYTYPMKMHSK